MGLGDEIMATGIAKVLNELSGKKVAFGKNNRLIFNDTNTIVFKNNPRIVQPGEEATDVVWSDFVTGNRSYIKNTSNGKMIWDECFRADRGEFYFDNEDKVEIPVESFIVVEPHTKQTVSADNKQWPVNKMQLVVNELISDYNVIQFDYGKHILNGVIPLKTKNIRQSAYVLSKAQGLITLEGGLHHAAAAVACPAVVIFSGYISPETTGYALHRNIFKADSVCGNLHSCKHCKEILNSISVEEVLENVRSMLND